jgi:hypothetical protein
MIKLNDDVKWWGKTILSIVSWCVLFTGLVFAYRYGNQQEDVLKLKDYKDGIQNHLVWDIKGQCFFVRPHTDVTTYLIRVSDCDKK